MSKMLLKYRDSAKNASLGLRKVWADNQILERKEPALGDFEDDEKTPEAENVATPQQTTIHSFAGIGDELPDQIEKAFNHAEQTDEEIKANKSFKQAVEDQSQTHGFNFKPLLNTYKILEGYQRVATIKESGSMTYNKGDVDGPNIQDYIKLMCEHKFIHQTKPVHLTINEKLIQNEDSRIAFFRNSINTLVDNGVDIERVRITNKAYRYLLDEFKQNAVELGLGNHDAESKAFSKVRKEPDFEENKTSALQVDKAINKEAANEAHAPDAPYVGPVSKGEMVFSNAPEPDLGLSAANDSTSISLKKTGVVADEPAPETPSVEAQTANGIKAEKAVMNNKEGKEGEELTSDASPEVKNYADSAIEFEKQIEKSLVKANAVEDYFQEVADIGINIEDLFSEEVSFKDVFGEILNKDPLFEPEFHAPPESKIGEVKLENKTESQELTKTDKKDVEKCSLIQNKEKLEEMFKNEDINAEIKKTHRTKLKP